MHDLREREREVAWGECLQVVRLARCFKLNFVTLTTVAKTLAILHRPEIRDTVEGLLLAKHVPSCDAPCRPPPATAKKQYEGVSQECRTQCRVWCVAWCHYEHTHYSSVNSEDWPWLWAICQCPMLVSPLMRGRGNRTMSPAAYTLSVTFMYCRRRVGRSLWVKPF